MGFKDFFKPDKSKIILALVIFFLLCLARVAIEISMSTLVGISALEAYSMDYNGCCVGKVELSVQEMCNQYDSIKNMGCDGLREFLDELEMAHRKSQIHTNLMFFSITVPFSYLVSCVLIFLKRKIFVKK